MLEVEIKITLKKTVSDPQGLTIKHALESLGFAGIESVRIGKLVSMKLDCEDSKDAQAQVEQMCKKLLANPIIEDYSFEIENRD